MDIYRENNQVRLVGTIEEEPAYDHKIKELKVYKAMLKVKRTSGNVDEVPIKIPVSLLRTSNIGLDKGSRVCIRGSVRTYNDEEGHVIVYIYVYELSDASCKEDDVNEVYIKGRIVKQPCFRVTPSGKEITDIIVMNCSSEDQQPSFIPCIAWGSVARKMKVMNRGEEVAFKAMFQSRAYTKVMPDREVVKKTAYEVSIQRML